VNYTPDCQSSRAADAAGTAPPPADTRRVPTLRLSTRRRTVLARSIQFSKNRPWPSSPSGLNISVWGTLRAYRNITAAVKTFSRLTRLPVLDSLRVSAEGRPFEDYQISFLWQPKRYQRQKNCSNPRRARSNSSGLPAGSRSVHPIYAPVAAMSTSAILTPRRLSDRQLKRLSAIQSCEARSVNRRPHPPAELCRRELHRLMAFRPIPAVVDDRNAPPRRDVRVLGRRVGSVEDCAAVRLAPRCPSPAAQQRTTSTLGEGS
jgi:hypothetical protein